MIAGSGEDMQDNPFREPAGALILLLHDPDTRTGPDVRTIVSIHDGHLSVDRYPWVESYKQEKITIGFFIRYDLKLLPLLFTPFNRFYLEIIAFRVTIKTLICYRYFSSINFSCISLYDKMSLRSERFVNNH
jgi:hypothetical protein